MQSKVFRSREALLAELDDVAKGKKDGEIPKQEGAAGADAATDSSDPSKQQK